MMTYLLIFLVENFTFLTASQIYGHISIKGKKGFCFKIELQKKIIGQRCYLNSVILVKQKSSKIFKIFTRGAVRGGARGASAPTEI